MMRFIKSCKNGKTQKWFILIEIWMKRIERKVSEGKSRRQELNAFICDSSELRFFLIFCWNWIGKSILFVSVKMKKTFHVVWVLMTYGKRFALFLEVVSWRKFWVSEIHILFSWFGFRNVEEFTNAFTSIYQIFHFKIVDFFTLLRQ